MSNHYPVTGGGFFEGLLKGISKPSTGNSWRSFTGALTGCQGHHPATGGDNYREIEREVAATTWQQVVAFFRFKERE